MKHFISRTFVFGIISLCFLLGGYYMSLRYAQPGMALFGLLAGAIVAIVGVVAGRNLGGDLAGGGGIAGAWKALTTKAKPEPPPEAQP